MSRSTISTFQLFAAFPDEETARKYLEGRLWADGVKCPECQRKERITERKNGYYRCNPCKHCYGGDREDKYFGEQENRDRLKLA